MWFRKKKNIDLFNHEIVKETDSRVSNLLKVPIASVDDKILEKLSLAEQDLSGISKSEILSIFKNENDELTKFSCLSYSMESKNTENQKIQNAETIESKGLSKGFSISYAIYYFFLKNNNQSELGYFLEKRRIPKSQNFHERLKNYFRQSEGVMLSDSYIQYAAGYEKEDVKPEDIKKAIQDLQEMDEEHGAFWVSVMSNKNDEFVIQTNKDKVITLIQGEAETKLSCDSWLEVEEIFNLQINKEFDKVISRVKK